MIVLHNVKPGEASSFRGLFPLTGVQEVVMVDPNDKYTMQLPLMRYRAGLRLREFLDYRDWAGCEVSFQCNEFAAAALQAMGGMAGRW